jgi:chaperone modulatory protein CbpM
MVDAREFCALTRLDEATIAAWRDAGWLRPVDEAAGLAYSEVDVARAQLIRDLRDDFGINDEGVPVILDLVDQLHGLRRTLRDVLTALGAEPDATRLRIMTYIGKAAEPGP